MEKREFLILALTIHEMVEQIAELAVNKENPKKQQRLLDEVTLRLAVFEAERPNHKLPRKLADSIRKMHRMWKKSVTLHSGE